MLYALGVGLGQDPMNEDELAFVYEKNLKVLPTMAAVLGYAGFWVRDLDTGIDWVQGGQRRAGLDAAPAAQAGRTPSSAARASSRSIDKGAGQGRARLHRAQGDRQGDRRADRDRDADHVLPRRRRLRRAAARARRRRIRSRRARPIAVCDLPTRPEMALIYRLSGDRNPLHAEPAVAKAGRLSAPDHARARQFRRRRARACSKPCAATIRRGSLRSPAASPRRCFPGETIRTEMWRDGAVVSFRARVVERDVDRHQQRPRRGHRP